MKNYKGRTEETAAQLKEDEPSAPAVYRLIKRKPAPEEAEGDLCYDLSVENADGVCILRDIARSRRLAGAICEVFAKGGVTPTEAPYILEDLMACSEWLD